MRRSTRQEPSRRWHGCWIDDQSVCAIAELVKFADSLEAVCIEAVESGEMTKDLAILISAKAPYLHTEEFLDAIDRRLQAKMA